MAAFPTLKNADVAAVATYIRNSWGNKASPVIARQAGEMRAMVNARKKDK